MTLKTQVTLTSKMLSKSFVYRLFSALVAITFLLSSFFFFGTFGLYVLASVVVLVMSHEVYRLTVKRLDFAFAPYFAVRLLWYIGFWLKFDLNFLWFFASLDMFIWLIKERFRDVNDKQTSQGQILTFTFYGLVAPTISLAHLKMDQGAMALFTLMIIVLGFDTFSYFFGKSLGGKLFKAKLFPKASPSKTIEGALGGLIGTSAFVFFIHSLQLFPMPQIDKWHNHIAIFSLISVFCLFSLSGDLLESLIKREANVKDSGTIMPGHGGLFDRLDGVLIASIFSYFVMLF